MAKKVLKKKGSVASKPATPVKKSAPVPPKRKYKTVRKVSGVRKVFRAWKQWDEGDTVIGIYIGQHEDNYDKSNPIIKVEDAQFSDESGDEFVGGNLVLNSTGMLDKAFEEIQEGQLVQVVYNGMQTIEKGKYAGKDSHSIAVDIVEEDNGDEEEEEEYDEEESEDGL